MTAVLCSENATETVKEGFVDLGVTQIWQVVTAARNVPFTTVLLEPGLPALGSSGTFGTAGLWVISRVPVRVNDDETGKKWNVTVTWTNQTSKFDRDENGDPVTDPTDAVKNVDIFYQEYAEPIDDALYISQTEDGPYGVGASLSADPPWLSKTITGPVRVSTGEPVVAERIAYRQIISVSRTERTWNSNYETYTNTVNDAQLTITETDISGTVATYTYEANTLRMKPIRKTPMWKDGKMYFRITFEMEHKATGWIHSEIDRSQKRRIMVGQYKPDQTTYTQTEVNEAAKSGTANADFAYVSIQTDDDTVAIGDPVKLNGWSAEIPIWRVLGAISPESDIYLNYRIYEEKSFGALNL